MEERGGTGQGRVRGKVRSLRRYPRVSDPFKCTRGPGDGSRRKVFRSRVYLDRTAMVTFGDSKTFPRPSLGDLSSVFGESGTRLYGGRGRTTTVEPLGGPVFRPGVRKVTVNSVTIREPSNRPLPISSLSSETTSLRYWELISFRVG